MRISYNLDDLPQRKGRKGSKSAETLAVIAFLADGKKRNTKIDYDTEKECKTRYKSLRKWRSDNTLQEVFDIYAVDTSIVIIKLKKSGNKKAAPGAGTSESGKAES